jgi:hypothetical protein
MVSNDIQIATLVVASLAVVGTVAAPVVTARLTAKLTREQERERWRQNLQLPTYVAFANSVDEFVGLVGGRLVTSSDATPETHTHWYGRGTAAFKTAVGAHALVASLASSELTPEALELMNDVSRAYAAVFVEPGVTATMAVKHAAKIKNSLEVFRARFRSELGLEAS